MLINKLFALSLLTTSWFLGLLSAFYFQFSISDTLWFVAGILLLLAIGLRTGRLMKKKQRRLATTALAFYTIGSLYFSLNDYRINASVDKDATTASYLVKVLEVGREDFQSQNLLVKVIRREEKGLLVDREFKFLLRVNDPEPYYRVDDRLVVEGELSEIENNNNPGEFNASWYYLTKGIRHRMFVYGDQTAYVDNAWSVGGMFVRWRDYLSSLMEKHLDGDFLGVSKALLLGDKEDLDKDVMDAFSNTGSVHVLAVSGLHVGLLLYILQAILSQFSRWLTKRQAILIAIVLVWTYGFLTGASPAVMRAVFMFSVVAIGSLMGKKSTGMLSLLISAFLLSLWDPWVMFDIGFQLSFAAMLGVFLLYPRIYKLLEPKNKTLKWLWEGNAVGLAATAFTTPITLYYFYQFPNYFLLANFGVMVFGFLVLLFGLIFLFSSALPVVSIIAAILFSFTILGLLLWVRWVDELPGAVSGGFHVPLSLSLVALLLVFGFCLHTKRKTVHFALWGGVLIISCLLAVGRSNYFEEEQLIFLNSNQFIVVLKTPEGCVACYEPRFGHANLEPQAIKDFKRYSGQHVKVIALQSGTKLRYGNHTLRLNKERFGWEVKCDRKDFFFQTYGALNLDPNVLHNLKLKKQLNGGKICFPDFLRL